MYKLKQYLPGYALHWPCYKIDFELSLRWLDYEDIDITNFFCSAVEQAWRLLQSYLQKFTAIKGPLYHKAVAKKLLSLSCSLPTWLVNDYKERNAAELLQLYVNFDLLEEAGELTIEYINAVLGIGKEYFGLKVTVIPQIGNIFWLPYIMSSGLCVNDNTINI